jgi:hypothetical protein
VAQRLLPVLADGGLSDSDNSNFAHDDSSCQIAESQYDAARLSGATRRSHNHIFLIVQ